MELFGSHYSAEARERRTKKDFSYFLKKLLKKCSSAKGITLVMDNLSTHRKSSLEEFFGKEEANKMWNKIKIYYTLKHASWLNIAEIAVGMYSKGNVWEELEFQI